MLRPNGRHLTPGSPLRVGRTGLASFVFALLHPGGAKAATVSADILTLTRTFGSMEIPFREVEAAEVAAGWFWSGIRIRSSSRRVTVSGLPKSDAQAFTDALESARVDWWQRTLAAHVGKLRSVDNRLVQLADPPRYMAHSVFSDLECDAKDAAAPFPSQWPDKLSGVAEIGMLNAIQDFLRSPEAHRSQANEAFVINELARSEEFFDKVEARPLTDEQRRAVVVDEDRNLVVAAAGSGKTSVIVAKAGWLLQKRYRRPSELLLLAFAIAPQKAAPHIQLSRRFFLSHFL